MEPREHAHDKQEEALAPEQIVVAASIERLKMCGVPEIRTVATWADVSINKDTTENRTRVTSFTAQDTLMLSTAPTRLIMEGNAPDTLHFQLRINPEAFAGQNEERIDAVLISYFSLISSFAKAVGAQSLEILNDDITYADSYLTVYGQAFENQSRYKEWANQQAMPNNPSGVLPFPNIAEERVNTQQDLSKLVYGKLPPEAPKLNFGIREYMLMINEQLPQVYTRLHERDKPLIETQGLVGNPALQQDFLAELSLLLLLFRQPDETFEQAIISLAGTEMLNALHDPVNIHSLSSIINESTHPLRSFIFVRAKLFDDAVTRALEMYEDVQVPGLEMLRDFEASNVGPIDLGMFGALAIGDIFLDRLDEGYRNLGFGEDDKRQSG